MLQRLLYICLLVCTGAYAGIPDRLSWAPMDRVIGHKVIVALPDGTVVSGKAQRVTPEALIVRVTHSGNETVHPRGRVVDVPRSTLRTLEVSRDSKHWRIIGASGGAFAGLLVTAAYAVGTLLSPTAHTNAVAVIAIPALGGGGYALGHLADKRMKRVEVF